MATIYDFTTRKPIEREQAHIEIIDYPELGFERVAIDGLVPRELAQRILALCEESNAKALSL